MKDAVLSPLAAEAHGAFAHDAFIYSSDEEFVSALVPFVGRALDAGNPAIAVTSARNIELLQAALGPDADRVSYVDAQEWYVKPAHTIAGYHEVLRQHVDDGAREVRVIGEVVFGSSEQDMRAWTHYESVLNDVFATQPVWIVCPYDTRALPSVVIDDARRTHPFVTDASARWRSERYVEPESLLREFASVGVEPHGTPTVETAVRELSGVRRLVQRSAQQAGLSEDRGEDIAMAVNEVLTNAFRHGAGVPELRIWSDGLPWVCEVVDAGPGFDDPLVGFRPPPAEAERGMGLWLARQLCDTVESVRRDGRFVVRLTAEQ